MPRVSSWRAGTNTRIEDLLSNFKLPERIIHNRSEIKNLDVDVDFGSTINIMNGLVNNSKKQLLKDMAVIYFLIDILFA